MGRRRIGCLQAKVVWGCCIGRRARLNNGGRCICAMGCQKRSHSVVKLGTPKRSKEDSSRSESCLE